MQEPVSDSPVLTILGASVRAAVQSAHRAGLATFACDLFADTDTRACSPALRVSDYPDGLAHAAREAPPGPWMYTGGLENHADLVDAVARERPLWGCGGGVLRRVRDPLALFAALAGAGLPALRLARDTEVCGDGEPWLVKPYASCGGLGIEFFHRASGSRMQRASSSSSRAGPHYYQQFRRGTPASAVFVARQGEAELLGATRQLIGTGWLGGGGFQYCGSIGPLRMQRSMLAQIQQIGRMLVQQFELRGLFGVDGVLSGGQFWTVEVNPRYTASVEVLERAGGPRAIALHAAAFGAALDIGESDRGPPPSAPPRQCGKGVVYAAADVCIGRRFAQFVARLSRGSPEPAVADIPHAGEKIAAGRPIATVLAEGTDEKEVIRNLRRRAQRLYASLESSADMQQG